MIPEMIALRIRVGNMGGANTPYLFTDFVIAAQGVPEGFPRVTLPTPNNIIDRGQGKILVREMAMDHGSGDWLSSPSVDGTHPLPA